jgi:AGCS family alanine or glycine:cation symporter
VCTITGLIVIISGAYHLEELNGIVLTLEAFRRLFFGFGDVLLLGMVFVFGISTLFTYSYYGVKCFGFLTKKAWGQAYNYFYIGSIIFSALATVEEVIGIIDLSFALMCIPNMLAIVLLAHSVKKEMQERRWMS